MPRCSACGATVAENEEICPDCGNELGLRSTFVISRGPAASFVGKPAAPTVPPLVAPDKAHRAKLTLRRGGALTEEVFPLGQRAIVGRSDPVTGPVDVDLGPLPEAMYSSRHHAELWQDPAGQWLIKDLGSQNGTFVRPPGKDQFQKVTKDTPIRDGDEIAFGKARFQFHAE